MNIFFYNLFNYQEKLDDAAFDFKLFYFNLLTCFENVTKKKFNYKNVLFTKLLWVIEKKTLFYIYWMWENKTKK